jgi:hypothetical protein
LDQNIVFILEIKIDGAVGDAGFFCNLGNGRLVKSLSGKNLDSRFKDLVIFMIFFNPIRSCPHFAILSRAIMNECSFIFYQNLYASVKQKFKKCP